MSCLIPPPWYKSRIPSFFAHLRTLFWKSAHFVIQVTKTKSFAVFEGSVSRFCKRKQQGSNSGHLGAQTEAKKSKHCLTHKKNHFFLYRKTNIQVFWTGNVLVAQSRKADKTFRRTLKDNVLSLFFHSRMFMQSRTSTFVFTNWPTVLKTYCHLFSNSETTKKGSALVPDEVHMVCSAQL